MDIYAYQVTVSGLLTQCCSDDQILRSEVDTAASRTQPDTSYMVAVKYIDIFGEFDETNARRFAHTRDCMSAFLVYSRHYLWWKSICVRQIS
jgi:hypothetical protein